MSKKMDSKMTFDVISIKLRNLLVRQFSSYPLRVLVEDLQGRKYVLNCDSGPHTLEWNIREALQRRFGLFWVGLTLCSTYQISGVKTQ